MDDKIIPGNCYSCGGLIGSTICKCETLSSDCLSKLPTGRFLRFEKCKNADGIEKNSVVWLHFDPNEVGIRTSNFDIKNGEYLGETL